MANIYLYRKSNFSLSTNNLLYIDIDKPNHKVLFLFGLKREYQDFLKLFATSARVVGSLIRKRNGSLFGAKENAQSKPSSVCNISANCKGVEVSLEFMAGSSAHKSKKATLIKEQTTFHIGILSKR